MCDPLHLFSLKERIFLVKSFYKSDSDVKCVKSKYSLEYGPCGPLEEILTDSIIFGVINLFEETGSVREISGVCLEDTRDDTESSDDSTVLQTEIKIEEPVLEESTELLAFVSESLEDVPKTKTAPKRRGRKPKSIRKKRKIDQFKTEETENKCDIYKAPAELPEPIKILEKGDTFNDHFKLSQIWLKFKIRRPAGSTGFEWINRAFQKIVNLIANEGEKGDKAVLEFHSPQKPEVKPVYLNLISIDALSPDNLLERLEEVKQSDSSFGVTDVFLITASIIHLMRGAGRNSIANMNPKDIRKYKNKSMIDSNTEGFCLPIALCFGKTLHMENEMVRGKLLKCMRRNSKKLLLQAKNLVKECGEPIIPSGKYDLSFIPRFSARYPEYLVTVYDKLNDWKSMAYYTERTSRNWKKKPINLFFDAKNNHYFCISKLSSFFNYRNVCDVCGGLYNHNHKICPGQCAYCNNKPACPNVRVLKKCPDCKREFQGNKCFSNHKILMCDLVCNEVKICCSCNTFYKIVSKHKCNTSMCFNCESIVEQPHNCYIQKYTRDPPKEFQIIFYDFECQQGFHCVTNIVCHICYKSTFFPTNCPNCDPSENIFTGSENFVKRFIDYVLESRTWPVVAIAHNAKASNTQLILKELSNRDAKISPSLIGGKVLSISVGNVTFLDSISFIPSALSKFSESFGLSDCKSDVDILRDGCLSFMISFLETCQINPFLQATSIEDAVMKVYRKSHMKEESLAITSNVTRHRSKIGMHWITLQKQRCFPNLKYDVKIKDTNYIVDGFNESSKTVLEFFECFNHGHTCLPNRKYQCSQNPLDTLENRYELTMYKCKKLCLLGYKMKTMWECDFRKTLKTNPDLNIETNLETINSGLGSAIYGERWEVFRTYCKVQPGDRIYHYNFRSLYPWVMKNTKYFKGHPTVIRQFKDPLDILGYEGVVKCKILPPRGLHLPVLPYRCNNRLTFPLCAVCVLEKSDLDQCTHSNDQRALQGYWSLDEIRLAIEKGYIILKALELWSYDATQTGLFAGYVNNNPEIKYGPIDCEPEQSKDHFQIDGVRLDHKGLTSSFKPMMNDLWMNFIQRVDMKQTSICCSREELISFVSNENISIHQLCPCGPEQLFVTWSPLPDSAPQTPDINLEVGICTKANARIAMYRLLSAVGKNILYCDTDSVIFIVPSGEENPFAGPFLGEVKDELSSYGEGSYIDEYVSAGSNSFGVRIINPGTGTHHYKVVFKGITMNLDEEEIDFDTLKHLALKMSFGSLSKTDKFTFDQRRRLKNYETLPFGY